MSEKKRAVGYRRVSSKESANTGESLTTQDKAIKDFCKSKGLELIKIYTDEGISGGTVKERPALRQFLKDTQNGNFNYLVITRLSRLGRNARELFNNVEVLKRAGIELRSIKENIDLSTPVGRAMFGMLSVIAELEREIIGENTLENRIELARKNIPTSGNLPYGRSYDKKTGKWGLVSGIKEKIQSIAQRYIDGHSIEILAKEMEMHPSNLLKILKYRCSNKWVVSFKGEKVKMDVPPLLDDEMIKSVHKRAEANNTYTHGHIKNKYLFSRVIFCGDCGYAMFGQTDRRGWRSYRHFKKGKTQCKDFCSSVPADDIESAVLTHLFHTYTNEKRIEKAVRKTISNREEIEKLRTEKEVYEKGLIELQKEKTNLLRTIRKGIISDEDAEKDMGNIRERKELLTNAIEKINPQIEDEPTESEILEDVDFVRAMASIIFGDFSLGSFDEKKELIQTAFTGKDKKGRRLGVYVNKNSQGDLCYTIEGVFSEHFAYKEKVTGKLPYILSAEEKLARIPIDPEYEFEHDFIPLNEKKSKRKKNVKLEMSGFNLYLNK